MNEYVVYKFHKKLVILDKFQIYGGGIEGV